MDDIKPFHKHLYFQSPWTVQTSTPEIIHPFPPRSLPTRPASLFFWPFPRIRPVAKCCQPHLQSTEHRARAGQRPAVVRLAVSTHWPPSRSLLPPTHPQHLCQARLSRTLQFTLPGTAHLQALASAPGSAWRASLPPPRPLPPPRCPSPFFGHLVEAPSCPVCQAFPAPEVLIGVLRASPSTSAE